MLVSSSRERLLAWGMVFCFIAAFSLISLLLFRSKAVRTSSHVLLVLSLAIPMLIMPSLGNEYIHINREQITIDSGLWYMPSTTVISLDQLYELRRDRHEFLVSNLIGDDYVTWKFERRDGSVQQHVLNDFFSAHSMVIAHYIRDRGYPVRWLYRDIVEQEKSAAISL